MDENNNNEDNKKRNKIIFIILWILLAIFIILFIFGNGYIFLSQEPNRRGGSIPTDIVPEDNNNTANQDASSGATTVTGPYSLHTGNQGDNNTTSENTGTTNSTGDNNGNSGDNNNTGDSGDSGGDDDSPQLTPEEIEKVKFLEGDEEFKQLPHLDIFNDTTTIGSKLIYPGLSGTYQFNVENFTDKNIEYKLSFIEENPKNVNMKFKLQRNGTYIGGNDSDYVSIQDICKEDLRLNTMMGDVYILHWKWVDSPNDINSSSRTERGNYKLTIEGRV